MQYFAVIEVIVTPTARKRLNVLLWLLVALMLASCKTYNPQAVDFVADPGEIHSETQANVTVSATLLSDLQSQRLYGVDLAGIGLQAIWLRVENRSTRAQWLLVSALDPDYYPPGEAAALFRASYGEREEQAIAQRFDELAMPLKTAAGEVSEGYVIAPRHEGGRFVMVKLFGGEGLLDFGFPITLADGEFDFENLNVDRHYQDQELPDLGMEQLREKLRELACCVSDESGTKDGDPLNLVLIGDTDDLLSAVSRAGWSFSQRVTFDSIKRMIGAAFSGTAYPVAPVSPLYLLGRKQDVALQKARSTIVQRNHLRLWLAPFRLDGRAVWIGQVSRDVAVKATVQSSTLTTHVIDPNVDEAREHFLQSLIVAGAVEGFGFVEAMSPVPRDAPRTNLTSDPWYTDGLRVVMVLPKGRVVPPQEARFFEWRNSADPIRRATEAVE
jgi:hypothetical protein